MPESDKWHRQREWRERNREKINSARRLSYKLSHPVSPVKVCQHCHEEKENKCFYKRGKSNGRDRICIECRKKAWAGRREMQLSVNTKVCSACGIEKSITDFLSVRRGDRIEYSPRCTSCRKEYNKKYWKHYPKKALAYERNKQWNENHKTYMREVRLKRNHGLPIGSYDKMLQEQGFVCAICGGSDSKTTISDKLSVDHDHRTGLVRGLLCNDCNKGLGAFCDSIETLSKAIEYLRRAQCQRLIAVS